MSKRLKELRLENNMTLLQVADKLGVTESTAQRYESGVIENLKYDTIVKLANIYNVSPAYLMGWDNQFESNKDNREQQLLSVFRDLNDAGQDRLLDYADDLHALGRYKKCDTVPADAQAAAQL